MQPINRYRSADLLDPPACQQEVVSVRDTAFEEVVADSMETMLTQGDAASFMAQLKQKDKTLREKIRDWFKDLANKLRDVVDAYKGYTPDSPEGRMVAQMEDFIGVLQEAYSEALMDASENYRAADGQKIPPGRVVGIILRGILLRKLTPMFLVWCQKFHQVTTPTMTRLN